MLKFYREGFMNGALAPNLPTELPALEKLEGTTFKVGNAEFEVLTFPAAEVKDAHALWHKGTGTLVAGDLVYKTCICGWPTRSPRAGSPRSSSSRSCR